MNFFKRKGSNTLLSWKQTRFEYKQEKGLQGGINNNYHNHMRKEKALNENDFDYVFGAL